MLRLENIKAASNPIGNSILLSWIIPQGIGITGVHIRRRTITHPLSLDDGHTVNTEVDLQSATDNDLNGGTVYYYSLFPYQGDPANISIDRQNRISALAVSPMAYSEYMYNLLPRLYHRYDSSKPDPTTVDAADQDKGQLQRYLDLIGMNLDLLHGYAKAVSSFHNVQQVDGQILPLLARWIGWKLDLKRELDGQRNEISNAPSLYKTIGILPSVQHTVKRISGWESQSKEFIHNVFLSNKPERLNLWSLVRSNTGVWTTPAQLFSMDYAYEGRPAFVFDNNRVRWLFYHTQQNGIWQIWYKTNPVDTLVLSLLDEFADGVVSDKIRLAFQDININLADTALIIQNGNLWGINDAANSQRFLVEPTTQLLTIYHLSSDDLLFSPSKPLVVNNTVNKYPSSALEDTTLWLFWSEYDATDQWRIHYRQHSNGSWLETNLLESVNSPFRDANVVDQTTPRYKPNAVVDRQGNLWLFWLEKLSSGWRLKYNKRSLGVWGATALTLPAAGLGEFRTDDDVSVLMATRNTGPQLYIFWSRNSSTGTEPQSLWQTDFQVKTDLNFDMNNWHGVYSLPKDGADENYHERDPVAVINNDGDVELFSSSNQQGNWAIGQRTLTNINTATDAVNWSPIQRITASAHTYRMPLAINMSNGRLLLLVRSNESIKRTSETYRSMETLDSRYAGSTTLHVRNIPKRQMQGEFDDFETYTFDTGNQGVRTDQNWYARDTIGVYLQTDTLNVVEVDNQIDRLRSVVSEFMPMTDRAVYIRRSDLQTENVYTYGQLPSSESRFIISTYHDEVTSVLEDSVLMPDEDFTDSLL